MCTLILFLQHVAEGKRGGEVYTSHLHSYLRAHFDGVSPEQLQTRPPEQKSIIGDVRASLALVRNEQPELVVIDVSSGVRKVLAARWMKRRGRKIMLVVQGKRMSFKFNDAIAGWLVRRFENYLIRSADILIVNSEFIAKMLKKVARSNATIVIANPGLEIPAYDQSCLTHETSESGSIIELLTVGELGKRKGTIYIIEALKQLSGLDCRLHIAGDFDANDPYFKRLQKLIDKHSLKDRVIFHGFLEHPKLTQLYRSSTIFLMPSLSEGYGMALAEALIFGLPVIATNVAAIPEMITDGVNGILVNPKDSGALAHAIRRLSRDPKLMVAMSNANQEKSRTLPTWKDFDDTLNSQLVPAIGKLTGLNPK